MILHYNKLVHVRHCLSRFLFKFDGLNSSPMYEEIKVVTANSEMYLCKQCFYIFYKVELVETNAK